MTEDDADRLIRILELKPHPEGGYYRETFRDNADVNGRAYSTAIYFLLRAGERSHWHRIDAAETWHFYSGAPLALQFAVDGKLQSRVLGIGFAEGQMPQIIVPPRCWQSAHSLGRYSLVGCTVAPGFLFDRFELRPENFSPV
jgi:uncharacterized protein